MDTNRTKSITHHSVIQRVKSQSTAALITELPRGIQDRKNRMRHSLKQDEAFLALDKLALRLSSCKPQEEFHDPRFMHLLLLRKALKSF